MLFFLHSAGRNCIKCINYSITFNSSRDIVLQKKLRRAAEMTGNESLIISQRTMTEAEPHAGKIISVKNGGKSGKLFLPTVMIVLTWFFTFYNFCSVLKLIADR